MRTAQSRARKSKRSHKPETNQATGGFVEWKPNNHERTTPTDAMPNHESSPGEKSATNSVTTKVVVVVSLVLAAIGCCLYLVAWSSSPPSSVHASGAQRRDAARQIQADTRTLIAALGYLLRPEEGPEMPMPSAAPIPGNLAGQPLNPSMLLSSYPSNRAETLFEAATNLPARS